nr:unnamed protein product [Callosobruchus analis]
MSQRIAHLKKVMTAPRKQCHVHLYRQVTLDHPDESEMHQIRRTCRTQSFKVSMSISNILQELPKQQRLLAEKIINDTLFQAEMNTLTLPPRAASGPTDPWQTDSQCFNAPIAAVFL